MNIKKQENIVGFILAFILLLSIINYFIYDGINNNYQQQIFYTSNLAQGYIMTNALYSQFIISHQQNLDAVLTNIWNKPLNQSGWYNESEFQSSEEWNKWKDKTVSEYWRYTHELTTKKLNEVINKTNYLQINPPNFLNQNVYLEIIKNVLNITQLLCSVMAIYFYIKLLTKR